MLSMPVVSNKDNVFKNIGGSKKSSKPIGVNASFVLVIIIVIAALFIAGLIFQILRAPQPIAFSYSMANQLIPSSGGSINLPWPTEGEVALELSGVGFLGSSGGNTPHPIWSVAKLMTAYVIYQDHPLSSGQQGPTITVTPEDVAIYNQEVSQHDSVVSVSAGESMSELVALEALLIPSGDNIATMLANWDAGSVTNFTQKMNSYALKLGMTNTHYQDASGLNPSTVSTAEDQLKLLKAVWAIPVLRQILQMPQVNLPPPSGLQYNYDYLIGYDGFLGGKTGSATTGAFAFVAKKQISNHNETIYGVVLDQHPHAQPPFSLPPQCSVPNAPICIALGAAYNLVNAVSGINLTTETVKAGTVVGQATSAWGQKSDIVCENSTNFTVFPGINHSVQVNPAKINSTTIASGQEFGTVVITVGSQTSTIKLIAKNSISGPSLFWKLTRI